MPIDVSITEPRRPWADLYWRLADETRANLERSRATIADAREFLAAEGRRREARLPAPPSDPAPSVAPAAVEGGRVPIKAWLGLGDGSPEQDEAIREAVGEIVQLHYLLIEGLCRHLPAMAPTIREIAQHLFEDATRLTDPDCCRDTVGAGAQGDGRMN